MSGRTCFNCGATLTEQDSFCDCVRPPIGSMSDAELDAIEEQLSEEQKMHDDIVGWNPDECN